MAVVKSPSLWATAALAKARVFVDAAAELMGDMPLYIQSFHSC
jgi:hypothetical protein